MKEKIFKKDSLINLKNYPAIQLECNPRKERRLTWENNIYSDKAGRKKKGRKEEERKETNSINVNADDLNVSKQDVNNLLIVPFFIIS